MMDQATLAFLRHRAFWAATRRSQDPEIVAVQRALSKEYLVRKSVLEKADVN